MKASRQWIRRAILWGATGGVTATMIIAGTSAQAAHTPQHPGASQALAKHKNGPGGYPLPKGIYKPFTDCPLLNPLMQESTGPVACIAGYVTSGTIKIGKITTKIISGPKVRYPVVVQYGIWSPPNAGSNGFTGGVLPPPGGLSAQLVSAPQNVRGGLLKALGCPARHDPTVRRLCSEAEHRGGKYLRVYASAETAAPITNFQLVTWTQPLEFHLINPLLGSNCYIGSADNPVVVNPAIVSGNGVVENDPRPRYHPDTQVLKVTGATATDAAFAAPGVTGCGPGGTANIAVDEAIDTAVGLPSASGSNSLTLNGSFYVAANTAPANMASILLSAFNASARSNGKAIAVSLTPAGLRRLLRITLHLG